MHETGAGSVSVHSHLIQRAAEKSFWTQIYQRTIKCNKGSKHACKRNIRSAPGVKSPSNYNIANMIYRRVPSLNVLLVFECGTENKSVSVQYGNIVWPQSMGGWCMARRVRGSVANDQSSSCRLLVIIALITRGRGGLDPLLHSASIICFVCPPTPGRAASAYNSVCDH